MRNNTRGFRAAFTLVELLAVIAIIVILAGLVVGGMSYISERQDREKAKVQLARLSQALEEYKLDMGVYPGTSESYGGDLATDEGGDSSEVLYTALFKEGYDYTSAEEKPSDWETKATKIYVAELDPRTSKQGWVELSKDEDPPDDLKIVDPWGNNYFYRVGSGAQNPDFDLWSSGKDGESNPDSPSDSVNDDDITNF